MAGVGEVERAAGYAGLLELVLVARGEGEGDGSRHVDAAIFECAVDEDGYGNEAASGGLFEVADPLVDTNGANDLLGFGDLVHLGAGEWPGQEGAGEKGYGESLPHIVHY